MAPMPSNMQWFMARPSAKPPHLNLVTCGQINCQPMHGSKTNME